MALGLFLDLGALARGLDNGVKVVTAASIPHVAWTARRVTASYLQSKYCAGDIEL